MPSRTIRQLAQWYERMFVRPPEVWLNGLALWAVIVALFIPPEAGVWWRLGALGMAFVLVHVANKSVARDRDARDTKNEERSAAIAAYFEAVRERDERIFAQLTTMNSAIAQLLALPRESAQRPELVEQVKASAEAIAAMVEENPAPAWPPVGMLLHMPGSFTFRSHGGA